MDSINILIEYYPLLFKLEQRCFSRHKPQACRRNWPWHWPWPSNTSKRGTKHVFRMNLAQISSAISEISAENRVFLSLVTLTFDLWPRHSNSSERQTKHVFPVNLVRICSAVPEIFHIQTKKVTDSSKKQNLTQFTACGNDYNKTG